MKMKKIITFLLAFITILIKPKLVSSQSTSSNCTAYFKKYSEDASLFYSYLNNTILFKNFNSLEELSGSCKLDRKIKSVYFMPNQEISLDSSFNMFSILNQFNFTNFRVINFFSVNGFNLDSASKTNKTLSSFTVNFDFCRFQFYLNKTLLTKKMCKLSNFNQKSNFFGSIKTFEFGSSNYYSTNTCPYVFLSNKLTEVTLAEISNSLILKNQLGFIDADEPDSNSSLYNRNLYYLNMGFAYEALSTKNLNKIAFKHVKHLYLWGIVTEIQADLFSNFKNINYVSLTFDNLRQLLHNSHKWLSSFNSDVKVDLNNSLEIGKYLDRTMVVQIFQKNGNNGSHTTFNRAYTFPDEDLCLFKDFPHEHLVHPILVSGALTQCTCTLVWLIKYSYIYYKKDFNEYKFYQYHMDYSFFYKTEYANHTAKVCLKSKNFKLMIDSCRFEQKFKACNKSEYKLNKLEEMFKLDNDIDLFFIIKWAEIIIFMFAEPFLCSLGLITNILTILILKHEFNLHNMKDKMYQHIYVNAIFNSVYCSLSLFKLINVCTFYLSPFCSSLYAFKSSQYFKIVCVLFLGNAMKLCCNFSYISFTFSRFCLSLSKKNGIYKKFEEINLWVYYIVIVVFSLLLSLFKLFQYQVNEIYNSYKSFPFEIYDIDKCNDNFSSCVLFRVLNLVNVFIKVILFIFVNLLIDVWLYNVSKANLENKKRLTKDAKKIRLAVKSKNRINRMIFWNGIIFSFAYFPEFITYILLMVYDDYLMNFCLHYISCTEFIEFAEFFNFISITFQFFIFKIFNNHFEENFNSFKRKLCFFSKKANRVTNKTSDMRSSFVASPSSLFVSTK